MIESTQVQDTNTKDVAETADKVANMAAEIR